MVHFASEQKKPGWSDAPASLNPCLYTQPGEALTIPYQHHSLKPRTPVNSEMGCLSWWQGLQLPSAPHGLAGYDEARTFMKTAVKTTLSRDDISLQHGSEALITLASRPHRSRSWSWGCRSLQKTALRFHSGHRRPPACLQWRLGRNPHVADSWMPPVRGRHLKLPFPSLSTMFLNCVHRVNGPGGPDSV